MSVNKVSDLGPKENLRLRDAGRRFINSYRASNYQESYVRSLEETIAYLSLYSEEHGWPTFPHITTGHLEEYFAQSLTRRKGYGERKVKGEQTISSRYLNRQYRQLYRFWSWMADPKRRLAAENVLAPMTAPKVGEKIVPTVSNSKASNQLLNVPGELRVLHVLFDDRAPGPALFQKRA